ncbi:hypothetical protein ACFBZI_04775 [Moraxella sp. ZJ142]|uniref:hypothetical protein n=1 Tax=Moraxella marmotae TaxID=3344520 RepID=UPI0035D4C9E8
MKTKQLTKAENEGLTNAVISETNSQMIDTAVGSKTGVILDVFGIKDSTEHELKNTFKTYSRKREKR